MMPDIIVTLNYNFNFTVSVKINEFSPPKCFMVGREKQCLTCTFIARKNAKETEEE